MKKIFKLILGPVTIARIKYAFPFLNKWELERSKCREEFYRQFVSSADLVFDVGANIGNRIGPMLNIGAKVVAIEPQEQCISILRAKFGRNINIVPMGLGEKEDIATFYISNVNTISSFSTDWINSVKDNRFKNCKWDNSVEIRITTLDSLIAKYGVPHFVKIDVEGYELEVLKGLTHSIKMISFEYTVPEQIQRVIECIIQIEKNSPEIKCNYSLGESMEFAFDEWLTAKKFMNFVTSNEFISTGFGDVYVKSH